MKRIKKPSLRSLLVALVIIAVLTGAGYFIIREFMISADIQGGKTGTLTGITYTSSLDSLPMKMDISYDPQVSGAPILLVLHGYSSPFSGTDIIERFSQKGLFAIKTYKRGMGGSAGTADDSARELNDFIDAIEYVKANYSSFVDSDNVNVVGYSGGGGNVYGLITKFPDYFRSANVFFGMSDYGYDDSYGWWNNGGDSYRGAMQSRIGGTPVEARNQYYARAHYLGAKNNPYTHIQLFYDVTETTCPVSHATQYKNLADAEGFTNVVIRTSDASTATAELSNDFSKNLNDWSFLGRGSSMYAWDASGHVNWATNRDETFDVMHQKFSSLRKYGKTDHLKASFKFSVASSGANGTALYGFKNSTEATLKNSVAMLVFNNKPYIRIDYNGTPLDPGNRELAAFDTTLSTGTDYYVDLEINNSVVTAALKDASQNTIETKVQNFSGTLGFDGVDSFGLYDLNSALADGNMAGTFDDLSITAYARWYHGYPQEGASKSEGDITAENYFVPDILAGTWSQPSLLTADSMFVLGYVKTDKFYIMFGDGKSKAGNLTYDISGDGYSSATAKKFTVEGLTGATDTMLSVYNLAANTQYKVADNNLTDGGATSASVTTDANGTLMYTGSLGSTHRYDIYAESPPAPTPTSTSTPTFSSTPTSTPDLTPTPTPTPISRSASTSTPAPTRTQASSTVGRSDSTAGVAGESDVTDIASTDADLATSTVTPGATSTASTQGSARSAASVETGPALVMALAATGGGVSLITYKISRSRRKRSLNRSIADDS